MNKSIFRVVSGVLLGMLIASNAMAQDESKSSVPVTVQVSLAPILPPEIVTVNNRASGRRLGFFLLGALGAGMADDAENQEALEFRRIFRDYGVDISNELTAMLQQAFKDASQPLVPLLTPQYRSKDPRELDIKTTQSATDLILAVNIKEVSLLSTTFSTKYVPRLVVSFDLVRKNSGDADYSESLVYGGGIKKLSETEIPADAKYAWETYNEAMTNPGPLIEAFREGIPLVARLAVQQIRPFIK